MRRTSRFVVALLAVALFVGGCGDDEEPEADVEPEVPEEAEPEVEPEPTDEPDEEDDDDAPAQGPSERYEVEQGDTLSEIAAQYDTTIDALVEANDIEDPDVLDVGQELVIPQD